MSPDRQNRSMALWLGLSTLVLFGGGGLLLMSFVQERSVWGALLLLPATWALPMAVGYGLLVALVAMAWLGLPFMHTVRDHYARRLGPVLPGRAGQWWLSACAGVGEEIFFRGALQHWLGIPWTALLFVAIHGYLDPRDPRLSSYGLLMTLAMIGIGHLAGQMGLLPAILAHAVIDVVLFEHLRRVWRALPPYAEDQA